MSVRLFRYLLLVSILCSIALSACGLKGPLYLPNSQPQKHHSSSI